MDCRGGMVQTAEQYEFIHRALALHEATLPPPDWHKSSKASSKDLSTIKPPAQFCSSSEDVTSGDVVTVANSHDYKNENKETSLSNFFKRYTSGEGKTFELNIRRNGYDMKSSYSSDNASSLAATKSKHQSSKSWDFTKNGIDNNHDVNNDFNSFASTSNNMNGVSRFDQNEVTDSRNNFYSTMLSCHKHPYPENASRHSFQLPSRTSFNGNIELKDACLCGYSSPPNTSKRQKVMLEKSCAALEGFEPLMPARPLTVSEWRQQSRF